MAAGGYPDDEARILEVLGRLKEDQNELKPRALTTCNFKEPSTAARLIAPDVRFITIWQLSWPFTWAIFFFMTIANLYAKVPVLKAHLM